MKSFIVSTAQRGINVCSKKHSDLNSPKSALFHLTGQPISQMGQAKVREGSISVVTCLWAISVDRLLVIT
jgi:hypothetical protein